MSVLPDLCSHSTGLTMDSGDYPRCSDCHTEMVFVPRAAWEAAVNRTPTEREQALMSEIHAKTATLLKIRQDLRAGGVW